MRQLEIVQCGGKDVSTDQASSSNTFEYLPHAVTRGVKHGRDAEQFASHLWSSRSPAETLKNVLFYIAQSLF
jgi:predicted AAA+ superfamily ATPase